MRFESLHPIKNVRFENLPSQNFTNCTRIHPRGGGAPFEKLELAFRNVLTQLNIGIFIGVGIVLHIVFFDEDYVKFSFRCPGVRILSVQQDLYRSVI